MLYFFNMVWPCTCEGKFCFSHLTYCDSDMIFQFFCSLSVVTRYDVTDVWIWAHPKSLPRALSRPLDSRSVGCSRFGLYHVAVVLIFLRSPISLAEIWVIYIFGWLDLLHILRIPAAFSFAVPCLLFTHILVWDCIIFLYALAFLLLSHLPTNKPESAIDIFNN